MVSIIIPARNEPFLQKTLDCIIENATGDYEIIVGLDGYWPSPAIKDHPKITLLHMPESIGMRPMINAMERISKGEYILKTDAHCNYGKGFDEILSANCEDNWIVVPRQYSLDDETWGINKHKRTIDYWYLSAPNIGPEEELGSQNRGLHGTRWFDCSKRPGIAEKDIDELMSFQGSFWFMTKKHFHNIGVMDQESYGNFAYEAVELGMKTWMMGGKVMVNKKTWYAHLHKGSKHGRGYFLAKSSTRAAAKYCIDTWMNKKWSKAVHDMKWLVEKFSPVPTWENFDWSKEW